MNNPRLAQRYAKSLIDIGTDLNQLDAVHNDILFLKSVADQSREFVLMLNSPIINPDKKYKVIQAITNGKISKITETFLKLLCNKNREANLPGVITSFIEQFNKIRNLHNAKLTTATPISKELTESFISKIKDSTNYDNVLLETVVDDKIIGGFILQMEGKLIDNSILRNLHEVKQQFANNDYMHKLR
ncbi:MAG TPA: ATP synthase F1 subunit delta [Hanamia sp.]|jgi:F-type H+-transporting ATPase subunit delta|nr:ATP synthase F1 subunit delta [Hanamia sp.]